MDREAEVLQDRIEIAPLERRRHDAQERVRSDQNKQIERNRDPGLHRQYRRLEARRHVAPERGHQRTEHGQDEHPQ
jgi:hypothetical protein